jgi:hypothetical protein
MTKIAVLFLVMVSGTIALAQQAAEWRPNIAEDNKAATWEDTVGFIQGSFHDAKGMFYGSEEQDSESAFDLVNFQSPQKCSLQVDSRVYLGPGTNNAGYPGGGGSGEKAHVSHFFASEPLVPHAIVTDSKIDLAKVDPLSIRVYRIGLSGTVGAGLFRVALEGHDRASFGFLKRSVYQNINWKKSEQLLSTPCSLKHCEDDTDDVRFWVVDFGDLETSRRVARALMHVALLCGGTNAVSPF